MSKAAERFTPAEARRLIRLFHRIGGAAVPCRPGDGRDELVIGIGEAASEVVSALLVGRAAAAGLVERRGGRLRPRPEASGFLRRILAGGGEEAFAAQHGETAAVEIEVGGETVRTRRNLDESPLASLARIRGRDGAPFLGGEAIEAGERLLADFMRGGLQPRVTASFEPRLSSRGKGMAGGQAELAASALAARQRFNRAVEAMGPELSGVAIDVCCFAKGLETVERERQWPARSAKLLLRVALMTLARHYHPPAPPARPRAHRWGAEDYRPGWP